jgi:hypothetical protein
VDLLATAAATVAAALDPGRMPQVHRCGSATAAHQLDVQRSTSNLHAGWTPSSTIFESKYYLPDLPRSLSGHRCGTNEMPTDEENIFLLNEDAARTAHIPVFERAIASFVPSINPTQFCSVRVS